MRAAVEVGASWAAELPAEPAAGVPQNFNNKIEDGFIKIESEDNRTLIIISHEKSNSTDKQINEVFDAFKKESSNIYSVVSAFKIEDRSLYKDRFASMIFTTLNSDSRLENFYCLALATNDKNTLFASISSTVQISSKLLDFSRIIIDSINFL